MKSEETRWKTRPNPFTTALVVGLGWGLVFGFVDGLPILLKLPILSHLRVRLQALTYLMVWYGLSGGIVLGLLGIIVWVVLLLSRRDTERRKLVAIYSAVSVGLATLIAGLHTLNVSLGQLANPGHATITLLLVGLGSLIGLAVGLGTYGWANWWQGGQGFLRPLRWRMVRVGVPVVLLVGVVALSIVGIYRGYLRDLAIFRPKPSGQIATPEQPNVILITIDALRADHLGVYGYDPEISPDIDGLSERSVVFDQAITQAPWTAPSTASFLTSLYPTDLGVCRRGLAGADLRVDEMRVTLAEILDEAGYRTQAYAAKSRRCPRESV